MTDYINDDLEQFNSIIKLHKPITFFGSARLKKGSFYYEQAKNLAFKCVEEGFSVITGGGGGIMMGANEGAFYAKNKLGLEGEKSIGFNIFLPFEQKLNDFLGYNMTFKSLAIRKMALIEKSIAFVIFPGGYGTLDELLEVLTLKQLGFKEVPIFVVGKEFWQGFDEFVRHSLLKNEMISNDDIFQYEILDDLDLIIKKLKENDENFSRHERRS
ncbi:TIGR00730 family Rossman fold protein [Campylobacter sp. MIT 12-8780]|uniref:LOG family protein n=1 Tax=unclassified Campylobacter TaxID=2593542 RepID=UPI0010F9F3AF|nr:MULTISPECIES: TIGR00730 family Rossman fold protein [unclassified Campylobacter]NDJ27389.1 TIGR00730 family Rossman fold protein [Campylobacter sp. MIT 19-121]TKX28513.1 TIGR00730 family Rossman fold protein [Campylobacter sp. MIT 12-5580]TQR40220.1 TIGR00730 family Rossman fold protein [Campylobacter sp. MIT 12-8780]